MIQSKKMLWGLILLLGLIASAVLYKFTAKPADDVVPPVVDNNLLKNGGFEAGLTTPWGTGQYSEGKPLWWNSGTCQSSAELDEAVKKSGLLSLYIYNPTPRKPGVYGTMAQRVPIRKNQLYRLTLWAKANDLVTPGAVSIIVDPEWKIRPVVLPAGSFSWKKFDGVFSLPADYADIRILSEDRGEVWIDEIRVVAIDDHFN